MRNGDDKTFFRPRYGMDNGRLIRTFEWTGILEVDSSTLVFRVLSSRLQNIRISVLAVFPLVIAFVVWMIFWGWLTPYLFLLPEAWWVVLAIVALAARIASLLLGFLGLVYLFDFLTLPV